MLNIAGFTKGSDYQYLFRGTLFGVLRRLSFRFVFKSVQDELQHDFARMTD